MRLLTVVALVTALLLLMPHGSSADPVDDAIVAQVDSIDALVQNRMKSSHTPGISLAIVRSGKPLLLRHYGLANAEWSVPVVPETVHMMGSLTKQFTAAAIMMLVEEGKIGLDEKIGTYLPDSPPAWAEVTVRHLLTHTSGIKDYINEVPAFLDTMRLDLGKQKTLERVRAAPLKFAPGTKWAYCNTGYFLLGLIIEQVTGKSYEGFLAERIFQPLQMTSTRLDSVLDLIPKRAAGYTFERGRLRNGEHISPAQTFAAGGLLSTVEDMAKWDAALRTEGLLKRSSLDQIWTPVKLNNGQPAVFDFADYRKVNYELGWFLINYQKQGSAASHYGLLWGATCAINRYQDDGVTVILFANSDGLAAYRTADEIHRIATRNLPSP
jgi:D-alanyl-D-alanine carboxypeptidase